MGSQAKKEKTLMRRRAGMTIKKLFSKKKSYLTHSYSVTRINLVISNTILSYSITVKRLRICGDTFAIIIGSHIEVSALIRDITMV